MVKSDYYWGLLGLHSLCLYLLVIGPLLIFQMEPVDIFVSVPEFLTLPTYWSYYMQCCWLLSIHLFGSIFTVTNHQFLAGTLLELQWRHLWLRAGGQCPGSC